MDGHLTPSMSTLAILRIELQPRYVCRGGVDGSF